MPGEKPKNYGQKLAESRSRILDLLLNTDDLADSILGEEPDVDDDTRAQLMDNTAELTSRVKIFMPLTWRTYWKPCRYGSVWRFGGW